ncbi:MAG: hypothetical protein QNJ97_02655 [Myxococcota bacterium]|nr:hypothetical protein [Myxococcota bacterium]
MGFGAPGCKQTERLDPELENLGRATGPVDPKPVVPQGMPQRAPSGKVHVGEVLERFDASRYTYLQIRVAPETDVWAAIPATPVKKGQQVEVVESMVMKDFESPTLKRTFPSIVFGVLKGHETKQPEAKEPSEQSENPKADDQTDAQKLPANHPPIGQGSKAI